jgi:multidrug transporter EmrE-like cation transporter
MAYFYLAAAFTLNAAANVLLKLGAARGLSSTGSLSVLLSGNWQLLAGLVLFAVNVLFYFLALRALPLSLAYPIMVAMSFLLINGYALVGLRETISPIQILGYLLIIAGLTLVVAKAS